jgi:hypothetical protein
MPPPLLPPPQPERASASPHTDSASRAFAESILMPTNLIELKDNSFFDPILGV